MNDEEFRALIEQQHQLAELKKHAGWAVLEDYALHGHGGSLRRQSALVNGGAKDIEQYRFECGYLAGIHHVVDAAAKVAEMVAKERAYRAEVAAAEAGEAT